MAKKLVSTSKNSWIFDLIGRHNDHLTDDNVRKELLKYNAKVLGWRVFSEKSKMIAAIEFESENDYERCHLMYLLSKEFEK